MPAKSKSQFRFMKAIQNGDLKKPGLSKDDAAEFTSQNTDYKDLPEKVKAPKFPKLRNMMKVIK